MPARYSSIEGILETVDSGLVAKQPSAVARVDSPELNRPIAVLLVDDHPVVRAGLRASLEQAGRILIVGEAGEGAAAVELARSLQPDVALLDVLMPDLSGYEIAGQVRAVSPATRVILISGAFDLAGLERGLAAGVCGFILKIEPRERLAEVVERVHTGGFFCSEPANQLLSSTPEGYRVIRSGSASLASLTSRERAMLIELAEGASLKQAARTIGITYKSADHLKQAVMKKLGFHDRIELARFAMREGLIS